jgi:hypothetical protein
MKKVEITKNDWNYYITEADKEYLKAFVEEVLATIHNDEIGVTYGLEDMALNAGAILGLDKTYMEELE